MPKRTPTRRGVAGRSGCPPRRKAGARPVAKKTVRRTPAALFVAFRERVRNRFGRQADDIWGVVLIVVAVLIGLAFIRHAGPVGRGIVAVLSVLVGVWAYAVPVAIAVLGVLLIAGRRRDDYGRIAAGLLLTFVGTLGIFHLMTGAVSLSAGLEAVSQRGGAVGSLMAFPLRRLIGQWGAGVVLVAVSAIGILAVARSSIREFALGFVELVRRIRRWARATVPAPQQTTRDQGKHRRCADRSARPHPAKAAGSGEPGEQGATPGRDTTAPAAAVQMVTTFHRSTCWRSVEARSRADARSRRPPGCWRTRWCSTASMPN